VGQEGVEPPKPSRLVYSELTSPMVMLSRSQNRVHSGGWRLSLYAQSASAISRSGSYGGVKVSSMTFWEAV
jgi:hypothetical protein